MLSVEDKLNGFIEDIQYEEDINREYLKDLNKVISISKQSRFVTNRYREGVSPNIGLFNFSVSDSQLLEHLEEVRKDFNEKPLLVVLDGVVYTSVISVEDFVVVQGETTNHLGVLLLNLVRVLGVGNSKTRIEDIVKQQMSFSSSAKYMGDKRIVLDAKLSPYTEETRVIDGNQVIELSRRIEGNAQVLDIPEEEYTRNTKGDIRHIRRTRVYEAVRGNGYSDLKLGIDPERFCSINLDDVLNSLYTAVGSSGLPILKDMESINVLENARYYRHKLHKLGEGLVKKEGKLSRYRDVNRQESLGLIINKNKVQLLGKEDKEYVSTILKNSLVRYDSAYFLYCPKADKYVMHDKHSGRYHKGFTKDAVLGNNMQGKTNKFHRESLLYITNILFEFEDSLQLTGKNARGEYVSYETQSYRTLFVYNGGVKLSERYGLRYRDKSKDLEQSPLVKYIIENNTIKNCVLKGYVREGTLRGIEREAGKIRALPLSSIELPIQTGIFTEKTGQNFLNEVYHNTVNNKELTSEDKQEIQDKVLQKLRRDRPLSIECSELRRVKGYDIEAKLLLEKYAPDSETEEGIINWRTNRVVLPLIGTTPEGLEYFTEYMESEKGIVSYNIYQDSDISVSPIFS